MKRPFVVALGCVGLVACADAGEVGTVSFPLSDANFFRLRLFASPAAVENDKSVFDSGCTQRQSRTFEMSNIPVGNDYVVVYEGFAIASCAATSRVELGYRGLVDIAKNESPYYHVPVYPEGRVATLPENLNLSASVAQPVDFCTADAACEGSTSLCYAAEGPRYWCVPTCSEDASCQALHARAECDEATGWCMLNSPYPLNLSEARAFGAAATLLNGDVLFVGGLRDAPGANGGFGPTTYWLERFDAATGLLAPAEVSGANGVPAGLFGFADLGQNRFVAAGGVSGLAALRWEPDGEGLVQEAEWGQVLLSGVVVFEPDASGAGGGAKTSSLSRGVAQPTVVPIGRDQFWVAGGLVASGNGVAATKASALCTIGEDLSATCAASVDLKQPRFAAAARCLDAGCQRILVVGGNVSGRIGEIVDLGAQSTEALETLGVGDKVFQPKLCGMVLFGGSTASSKPEGFQPVRLSLDGRLLDASAVANAPLAPFLGAMSDATSAFEAAPTCFLGGGFAANGSLSSIVKGGPDGVLAVPDARFGQARLGASAARVGSGVLAGRIVFAGGVTFPAPAGDARAEVVRGLEVLSP